MKNVECIKSTFKISAEFKHQFWHFNFRSHLKKHQCLQTSEEINSCKGNNEISDIKFTWKNRKVGINKLKDVSCFSLGYLKIIKVAVNFKDSD